MVIATVVVTMTTMMTTIRAGVVTATTVVITMVGASTATTTDPCVTGTLEGLAAAVAASQANDRAPGFAGRMHAFAVPVGCRSATTIHGAPVT
ncbi:hypothetical protein D3C79_733480 [compost metagenome]